MERAITTRIVGKFQTTVPPEIRDIYDLREGDLLDWRFDQASGEVRVIAKRAQMITPQVRDMVQASKKARQRVAEPAQR